MNKSNVTTIATLEWQSIDIEDKLDINGSIKDDCESLLKGEVIDITMKDKATSSEIQAQNLTKEREKRQLWDNPILPQQQL